jgi:hypothetical protein
MTSIVPDFDAIRPRMPGADLAEETPHPAAPAALIAEERRAWNATSPIHQEYVRRRAAWEEANPHLNTETALPPEISALKVVDSVLARLPVIAAAGDPVAATASVAGDRYLMRLFERWAEAFRFCAAAVERESDEVFDEALAKANRFEDAIAETPAEGIVGLAVKVFFLYRDSFTSTQGGRRGDDPCALNPPNRRDTAPIKAEMAVSAIRDIARLVPELAPLCAPTLAEYIGAAER